MIELLTGLMLFGMIASILYAFLLMGSSMYRKVSAETQLRNQADALFGQIMSELKDAVYVRQGESSREILFVRKAQDPLVYVETYRMIIETDAAGLSGVTVAGPDPAYPKRWDLTPQFRLNEAESALLAASQNLVKVTLVFERADAASVTAAEDARLKLESSILLFRME